MKEAAVPNYTAVPCPRPGCYSGPGQECSRVGSCRDRRLLWAALADAQASGDIGVWWCGAFIQVQTTLRAVQR